MEIIAFVSTTIKEIFAMAETLSHWRFIAILITFLLALLIWKLPEILTVFVK